MRLVLLVIVLGMVAGRLAGGRLERIPRAGVRWPAVALVGLALQLAPLPGGVALALLYASFGLLLGFAAANLRLAGFALVLVGLALNLAVIGANAGMPVARRAIVASGQQDTLAALLRDGDGVKHHLARPGTRLLPLADVIAVPPPVRQVISVGDVVVDAGIVWFIVAATRGGPGGAALRRRAPGRHARRRRRVAGAR
jgi:Family of unknown function (DUF5317)